MHSLYLPVFLDGCQHSHIPPFFTVGAEPPEHKFFIGFCFCFKILAKYLKMPGSFPAHGWKFHKISNRMQNIYRTFNLGKNFHDFCSELFGDSTSCLKMTKSIGEESWLNCIVYKRGQAREDRHKETQRQLRCLQFWGIPGPNGIWFCA